MKVTQRISVGVLISMDLGISTIYLTPMKTYTSLMSLHSCIKS